MDGQRDSMTDICRLIDRQTKGQTEGQIDGWTDGLTVSELRNHIPFWQHLCAAMKSTT